MEQTIKAEGLMAWRQPPQKDEWRFSEPKDTATYTTNFVLYHSSPIVYVTRRDEIGWQFLGNEDVTTENLRIVSLNTIVDKDASISELADLPLDWEAWREGKGGRWNRRKIPPNQ